MRLLQIVQKPQRRGAETFARQLGAVLRRGGHEVRTAYLEPWPGGYSLRDGDVLLGSEPAGFEERVPGLGPARLKRLQALTRRYQPDVVQVGGGRTVKYGVALGVVAGSAMGTLVWRNIGMAPDWVRGGLRKAAYRRVLLPQVDGVISVTEASAESFRKFYRPRCPLEVIPTGVDSASLDTSGPVASVRDELATSQDARVVLFVGSLAPEKRVDRLLRIAAAAAQRVENLAVWIVGAGPLAAELAELASASGLEDRVTFTGSRPDVGRLMAAADVLALTSDSEGIPRVVLEAGLARLPVLAPRVGGIAEFVEPGVSGELFDPSDESGAGETLVGLLQDAGRRRRLGEALHATVATQFTMDVIAERYLDFYRRLGVDRA